MTDPINLRQARKAKARTQKERLAEQNRVTFGQTKAAKKANEAQAALTTLRFDSLRLMPAGTHDPD